MENSSGAVDPRRFGGFGFDAVTRAWANHLIRPQAVIGGWAAAALYRLRPDWPDSAPVLLFCPRMAGGSTRSLDAARYPRRPVIRPLPVDDFPTCCPCPVFPDLQAVVPPVAAVHCLWTILSGRHTWWVHDVPGLTRRQVAAVQFIDAFAQCTWVTRGQIQVAASGTLDRSEVATLLDLADDGAQSPMETTLRLLIRDLLPAHLCWKSQLRVDLDPDTASGWTSSTLPDLGCEELKLAIYYDGAYHDADDQRTVDFDQFHALRDLGWEVLRFNRATIRDAATVRKRVRNAIDRAL